MKEEHTFKFGDAFKKFLKEEHLDQTYNEKKLISTWNELMGKPIANRTSRIFIKDRIMYVKLTSAPLKQELTMSKEKVLDLILRKTGEKVIDDIRFL